MPRDKGPGLKKMKTPGGVNPNGRMFLKNSQKVYKDQAISNYFLQA